MAKKLVTQVQKLKGEPFKRDDHNEKLYRSFEAQAPEGCYTNTLEIKSPPKSNDQLGYWYGGILGEDRKEHNGMVRQMIVRGDNVLYKIEHCGVLIPVMVNKTNCDFYLKAVYMASIGEPGQVFKASKSDKKKMSALISWTLDYLAEYKQVYIMSSEEYERLK